METSMRIEEIIALTFKELERLILRLEDQSVFSACEAGCRPGCKDSCKPGGKNELSAGTSER